MQVENPLDLLDQPEKGADWLRSLGVENVERSLGNVRAIAEAGITLDLLAVICAQLAHSLPQISDPDMALNNLERFVRTSRNPLSLAALFERDRDSLHILLQLFSSSQYLSDQLVRDPESYDLLRLTEGQAVARETLVGETCSEIEALTDDRMAMTLLRRFKHRELLRIAYGDIIRSQKVDVVTGQLSFLADALCEAALRAARRKMTKQRGIPRRSDGAPARFVVIGMGKLGGNELNYSSDIDLVFLYEEDGQTDGERPVGNHEYFERVARELVKLLTQSTDLGITYRVDLRLRPEGSMGPPVTSLESALHYYDVMGRTWERQAFVKARPVAGDLDFGRQFLAQLEPWIYQRYLTRAEIGGIKALKRSIERKALQDGSERNVKTGLGGIRDIEFVIQFLQLLNGGDLRQVRTGNTLDAIAQLEQSGCLTFQERTLLEENYAFLRKVEHRLQIMFDLQTHTLPDSDEEMRKLAIRMGYGGTPHQSALDTFRGELKKKTQTNRQILDHLLHDAFSDEDDIEPEVDLVLDPDPAAATIHDVLARHGFQDVPGAYRNLIALATERVTFLSTRRCRHFLASIAPRLLESIASTPDPDSTLVNLSRVSDSLGGKGVLWELFSFNPPSLNLYVRLCATSPYLSSILTSNPGMIDELLDSMLLDKLPTIDSLDASLTELLRGAVDLDPILHSFKNSHHLRVGVRDILRKDDIQDTNRALSDIAEICLRHVVDNELAQLAERFGPPTIKGGARDGDSCDLVILAMGKLGGREPNYHSDLDVIFLYEADGTTSHRRQGKSTTNQHFFSQLGQRIVKVITHLGPYGRLYEVDPRLRPTGKSGAMAVSVDEFRRYFEQGHGQLWERQALCKARAIYGSANAKATVMDAVRHVINMRSWQPDDAASIRDMRQRMEETASSRNLKRGSGGTVDVEFAVQMLQLKHVAQSPEVLVPGTLDALDALAAANHLSREDSDYFKESYRFLRNVEAHLRLLNTSARHDVPEDEAELKKLSFLLGYDPQQLLNDTNRFRSENRLRFDRLFDMATS